MDMPAIHLYIIQQTLSASEDKVLCAPASSKLQEMRAWDEN